MIVVATMIDKTREPNSGYFSATISAKPSATPAWGVLVHRELELGRFVVSE